MTNKLAYKPHCKRIRIVQKIAGIYSIQIGKLNTEQSCQSVLVWAGVEFVLPAFLQDICSRCIKIN